MILKAATGGLDGGLNANHQLALHTDKFVEHFVGCRYNF
jgi:hypothetical protein